MKNTPFVHDDLAPIRVSKHFLLLPLLSLLVLATGCCVDRKNVIGVAGSTKATVEYSPASFTLRVGSEVPERMPSTSGGDTLTFALAEGSPQLPDGVTLDPDSGILRGTPSTPEEEFLVIITASNSTSSAVAVLNITVLEQLPCLEGYSDALASYQFGMASADNVPLIDTSCGPIEGFSIEPALPAGLEFDTMTGVISGIPQELLTPTEFTVTAFNSGGDVSITLSLEVMPVFTFIAQDQNVVVDAAGTPPSFIETLSILEDPQNPNFPNPIHSFVMAATHDAAQLDILGVEINPALMVGGSGPDFFEFTETSNGFFAGIVIDLNLIEVLLAEDVVGVLNVEYGILPTADVIAGIDVMTTINFEDGLAAAPSDTDNAIASGLQRVVPERSSGTIAILATP